MNKIEKFLRKMDKKKRIPIKSLIGEIMNRRFEGLDNKKLKGFSDIFRVRKGKIRIIYQKIENKIIILVVDKKRDDTYSL
mgnify:CR=1 FL=1